ncbi:VPLPA-CTERM sorting domain-containing protein [Ampullimonas aquatilis]|uniref:VPLPA-CTERM sorting domain-containing protein n=1 Tax=Ampullimonas aquatilis TaxID=1341549 RepID=UPI003C724F6C
MKISLFKASQALAFCAVLLTACVGTSVANASVIYSNYTASDSLGSQGRTVYGTSNFAGGNDPAYSFVATSTGSVSEIDLGLSITSGNVVASLWSAATGCGTGSYSSSCGKLTPTAQLGAWNVPTSAALFHSISNISGVILTTGNTYFMRLSPGTPTTQAGWRDNVQGASGQLWQCGGSNASYTACLGYTNVGTATSGGFAVLSNASPVPLPAAAWLMLGGLSGLGVLGRKKRTA